MLQQIFDELYDKIKEAILPQKKEPPVVPVIPVVPKSTETKIPQQSGAVPLPTSVILPIKNVENTAGVSLARGTLNLEQQRELLEERRKVPVWILFLKYVSLLLTVGGFVAFIWIKVDMDPANSYLKFFGVRENTGMKFENLNRQIETFTRENGEFSANIQRFTKQIEDKNYSIHTANIEKIRNQELTWFDEKNPDGSILEYGILDAPTHMEEYFNSKSFDDPLLSGTGNNIAVSDVTADRKSVNFSVKSSHLFGRVFSLDTEFVKMINSFPLFKNGELNQFSKKKDTDGNDVMDFGLKLDIQDPNEIDPDDQYFSKYENWFKSSISSHQ